MVCLHRCGEFLDSFWDCAGTSTYGGSLLGPRIRYLGPFVGESVAVVAPIKWLGPLGVASLTFSRRALLRQTIFSLLGWYVGAVVLGAGIQMFVVYPLFSVFSEQAFACSDAFTFYAGAADGFLLIQ